MKTVKYLFLVLAVFFISCKEESNPVTSEVDFSYISKNWISSYEEQTVNDVTQIFRPSDYKVFPPSRYREQLQFTQDSNCSYLVLAPNDAHYFLSGKWSLVNRENKIVEVLDSTGAVYKKFQVVALKQDLLKFIIVN